MGRGVRGFSGRIWGRLARDSWDFGAKWGGLRGFGDGGLGT